MLLHLNEIDPLPKLGAKVEPKRAPVIVASKVYDWRCATASDKPTLYWTRSSIDAANRIAAYMHDEFGCF